MSEICAHTEYLERITSTNKSFDILRSNPQVPVVITTRDPMERFISGLTMVETHVDPMRRNDPDYPEYFAYYVGAYRANFGNQHASDVYCPYDLGDSHVAHHLFRPLMLIAGGHNVEIVNLSDYSDHLIKYYPHCEQLIHDRITNKHEKDQKHKLLLSYQSVFDNNFNHKFTWAEWITQEVKIYQLLEKYRTGRATAHDALQLFKQLVEDDIYFYSIFSPHYGLACQLASFLVSRDPVFQQFRDHKAQKIDFIVQKVKNY